MSLKGIISISGQPGLYKVLAQTKSGFIVESLTDKKRIPVAATQKISMLEDISVFTESDDLPLTEVMLKLKDYAAAGELADAKEDPSKLKTFFKKVIPEFDQDRVYPSDIKKIINWYHLVKDFVADKDEVPEVSETEKVAESEEIKNEAAKSTEEQPKKKKAATKIKSEKSSDAEPATPKTRKKKESS